MGLTCTADADGRTWNTVTVVSDTALFPQDTTIFSSIAGQGALPRVEVERLGTNGDYESMI
jgi:hypothetical protein